MQNYGNALKYEEVAADSAGTATEKYEAYLGGIEAHLETLKAAGESLSMTLLSSDTVNGFVTGGTKIIEVIDNIVKSVGLIPTLGGALGLVLGMSGQGIFGKNSLLSGFGYNRGTITQSDLSWLRGANDIIQGGITGGKSLAEVKASTEFLDKLKAAPTGQMRQLAKSLDDTGTAFERVQTTGQKFVGVLKNIGSSILTSLAISGALLLVQLGFEAITNAINSESIAIDDLESKTSQYEQTQTDLASAESEQTSIRERLAELNNVEFKSIAEESETQELRIQNAELTRQIQLLKDKAELEEKDVKDAAQKVWEESNKAGIKTSYDSSGKKLSWWESISANINRMDEAYAPGYTNTTVLTRVEGAVAAQKKYNAEIAEYNSLSDKITAGTATESETSRFDVLKESTEETRANILEIITALGESGLPEANTIIDQLSYTIGTYSERVDTFGNTFSTVVGTDAQNDLLALASSGKLTTESLSGLVSQDALDGLNALTGSTEQTILLIKALALSSDDASASVASTGASLGASFTTIKSNAATLQTQISALNDAQAQYATDGYITVDTLDALTEAGIEYRDAIEEVKSSVDGSTGTYKISLETLRQATINNAKYEWSLIQIKKATAESSLQTELLGDANEDTIANLQEEIALYNELGNQIEVALSSLTAYKDAVETANASANYDYATETVLKTITDGLDSGRIATDEFKAALSFFTDGSFGDTITQEDIPAIQAFTESISDLTKGGFEGLNAATERFTSAGLLDANGFFKQGTTLEDAAKALGENVGTEFAYSILKSYEDYGFDINFEAIMEPEDWVMVASTIGDTANKFLELEDSIIADKQALSGLTEGSTEYNRVQAKINNTLDSMSSTDIQSSIADLQALIDSGKYTSDQTGNFQSAIDGLNAILNQKDALAADVEVTVTDNATPVINSILELIPDSKTIKVNVELGSVFGFDIGTTNTPSTGSSYSGKLNILGYPISGVSGNANVGGTWGNGAGGKTLVGELGREIVVNPATNRWYTVGNNGAQFVNLPQNAIVFNHLQTESILSQGHVGGRGSALISGNAAASIVTGGGLTPVYGSNYKGTTTTTKKVVTTDLAEVYKNEIALLEIQVDAVKDLVDMYEKGSEEWFSQQQRVIDTYKEEIVLAQSEYDRLVASGADINSEEVQSVLKELLEYQKDVYDASEEYWEAQKDNATETLEYLKSQAQAVVDLKSSYHELTKSIAAEQRELESELKIAAEAYPNLTESEREAIFSGDDYQELSNKLASIAATAATLYDDYMQQIQDVGEESSYELEAITAEFQSQYDLQMDAYNVAKNELAVLKAKKNLENVQGERSVAMLVGGMWTWVADAENVKSAMESLADAETALADAQSDATFNADTASWESVVTQIDEQISAIDALVYSNDDLATEIHSLVDEIRSQVSAAMSSASLTNIANLPMYTGTSTDLFTTSALQNLLLAGFSGDVKTPISSIGSGTNVAALLGAMGYVSPSSGASVEQVGDTVIIHSLTLSGEAASQIIAILRANVPLV